ncbi:hypothetical protein FRC11_002237 [Ceratobasidium sp. 423]|nr:hypothetical protein FRC11_002237 [Ceratobasidium sp. 423]
MLSLNPHPATAKEMSLLTSQPGPAVYIGKVSDAGYDDNPAEIPSTKPAEPVIRHPEFFFDNTLIAIQVENTLFNVHKYQLAKSEVFTKMFKMPKPENGEPEEGSSPEHPIVIRGAAASDFTALLRVLYASHFASNQPAPEAPLIVPAFRLANLLRFSELRAYLLPLAEKNLDDVDKIVFAREFEIKEWLAPAHIHLCKRDAVLSPEEARKLEVDSVLLIWRMREQHRGRSSAAAINSFYCRNCVGMTYCGNGYTCEHCRSNSAGSYFRCTGPGAIGTNTSTADNTTLEAEVKKWVEDSYATKGK